MRHPERLRLVVDTNVWVSYLLTGSFAKLADVVASRQYVLLYSKESLAELERLKDRRKITKAVQPILFDSFIHSLRMAGRSVVLTQVDRISRDPKDDHILALAKFGKAHLLVTGDKDLLVLKQHSGTRILSPTQFFREFAGPSR